MQDSHFILCIWRLSLLILGVIFCIQFGLSFVTFLECLLSEVHCIL